MTFPGSMISVLSSLCKIIAASEQKEKSLKEKKNNDLL
jgi:hypothetical protein